MKIVADAPGTVPGPDYALSALAALSEGVVMQLSSGEIVACNPAAERILGLTRDQMMGRTSVDPAWKAVHEDGSPFPGETHPAMVTLRTGESLRDVVMGVHVPGGSLRWISVNSEPILGPEGRPGSVVTTFVDVTDRKDAREALRASEEKYRQIVETAYEGIWQVDADSRTTFVNGRMAEMLGYAPEEILGKRPPDFVVDEECADAERRIELARKGIPESYERRYRRKDGSEVWMHLARSPVRSPDGSFSGILAMVTDVTDRRRADEELRQSERNLRSFFDTIGDFVFVLDDAGRIVHTNKAVRDRLGYIPDDLVGRGVLEVHPVERRGEAGRIVTAMLAGETQVCLVPLVAKDGTAIPVETRVVRGRWSGRDALFGISKDLSDLQASEERFEKAFRSNPSPMTIRSLPTGRILDVNDAFVRDLGFRRDDVVGRTSIGLGAIPDEKRLHEAEKILRARSSFRDLEMDVRTRDGRIRHGVFSGEIVELARERVLLTVMNDVTALRQAEEARKESEAKYRLLAANSADVISLIGPDGVIRYVSPSCQELVGYEPSEMIGRRPSDFVMPEDRPLARASLARHLAGEDVVRVRYRGVLKDGRTFWAEAISRAIRNGDTGEIVELQATVRDITEMKEAEDALQLHRDHLEELVAERTASLVKTNAALEEALAVNRRSEKELRSGRRDLERRNEELRALFESASAAMALYDAKPPFRLLANNRRFQESYPEPLRTNGMVGLALPEFAPEAVTSGILDAFCRVAETGQAVSFREFPFDGFPGGRSWWDWHVAPVVAGGSVVALSSMRIDVTLSVLARQRVETEMYRVKEANRELEAFSYSVSHDLRTPLRAVNGFASLLESRLGGALDEESRRLLKIVKENSLLMGSLVDGLVEFAQLRYRELFRERVEMKALAERVVAGLLPDAPHRDGVDVRVAELPCVFADPDLVAAALGHLLSNAIKFSAGRPNPVVEVGFEAGPDGPVYFVKDNGVGFDPKYADKLFGVFHRLDGPPEPGHIGLGLALARRIVERHGGWIRADGQVGQGAVFRFSLAPA